MALRDDMTSDLFAAVSIHDGWNGKSSRGYAIVDTLIKWGWTKSD